MKTQDAVINNLRTIGEAARIIPKEVRQDYPDVEWEGIIGFRNFLIHEYSRIDLGIIWQTIKSDLPILERRIREILRSYGNGNLDNGNDLLNS